MLLYIENDRGATRYVTNIRAITIININFSDLVSYFSIYFSLIRLFVIISSFHPFPYVLFSFQRANTRHEKRVDYLIFLNFDVNNSLCTSYNVLCNKIDLVHLNS